MGPIIRTFDRFGELYKHLTTSEYHAPKHQRDSHDPNYGFTRTHTFDEALDLLQVGWPEGLVEMGGMVEDIERTLLERVPGPVIERDVTGSDVDIGAFLTGEPEHMIEWKPNPAPTDGVKILVNCTASADVSPATIMSRGAAVVSMLHALRIMEIPSDLYLAWGNQSRQAFTAVLHASRPDHEADIERLAFAIAHPSMLRRLVFALMEQEQAHKELGVGAGYGHPRDHKMEDATLTLPSMMGDDPRWSSPSHAVEWVLKEFDRMGIELEEA